MEASPRYRKPPRYWLDLAEALCGPQQGMPSSDPATADAIFIRGNVLSLESLSYIPGGEELDTRKIWISTQYASIAVLIEEVRAGEGGKRKRKNFHLIGTAGTGKSTFGVLWLYYQAKRKGKVVYRTEDGRFVYFDFSGLVPQVLIADSMSAYDDLVDAQTWLIIDGASTYVTSPGPILQCVSDTKSNHYSFAKRGIYVYMEAWTLQDCEECATAVGLTIADMPARYYYCGGVPRYIFYSDTNGLKDLINDAFASVFMHMLKNPDASNDKIFHYRYPASSALASTERKPVSKLIVPASDYVELKMDELFKLDTEEQRDKWVRETADVPEAAGL